MDTLLNYTLIHTCYVAKKDASREERENGWKEL